MTINITLIFTTRKKKERKKKEDKNNVIEGTEEIMYRSSSQLPKHFQDAHIIHSYFFMLIKFKRCKEHQTTIIKF